MREIKIGDLAVIRSHFGVSIVKVERLTAKKLYYKQPGSSREWQKRIEDVVFSGPEDVVKLLHQRLESSKAMADEERRNSFKRMLERNDGYVRDAEASIAESSP